MKIGMITDSLPGTDFDTLLATAARLQLDLLEFGCGNWSSAPHLNLDCMLESDAERRNFKPRLAEHGIGISALNCSGSPMLPALEGVEKSVAFLCNVLINLPKSKRASR
jgi:sugar phosphate isomerase/epimerase